MALKNLLIVEDEKDVAQSLKAYIERFQDRISVTPICAYSYDEAVGFLRQYSFDLVLTDLLLLPPDSRIDGGNLRFGSDNNARSEPMEHDHWKKFVVDEGGVGLVNSLRKAEAGEYRTKSDVPVLVLSYFDSAPGYMNILRRLNHPNTIFMPKINKNPNYADVSHDEQIKDRFSAMLANVLIDRSIYDAEKDAQFIRDRVQFRRQEGIGDTAFGFLLQNKYLLRLIINLTAQPDIGVAPSAYGKSRL